MKKDTGRHRADALGEYQWSTGGVPARTPAPDSGEHRSRPNSPAHHARYDFGFLATTDYGVRRVTHSLA
jgi:hypothetical protein